MYCIEFCVQYAYTYDNAYYICIEIVIDVYHLFILAKTESNSTHTHTRHESQSAVGPDNIHRFMHTVCPSRYPSKHPFGCLLQTVTLPAGYPTILSTPALRYAGCLLVGLPTVLGGGPSLFDSNSWRLNGAMHQCGAFSGKDVVTKLLYIHSNMYVMYTIYLLYVWTAFCSFCFYFEKRLRWGERTVLFVNLLGILKESSHQAPLHPRKAPDPTAQIRALIAQAVPGLGDVTKLPWDLTCYIFTSSDS